MAQINAGQQYSHNLGHELLYFSVPVLSGGSISGAVRLSYPASIVSDQVNGQMRTLWSVAATTALSAGMLALFMARAVTRGHQQLRTATELLAGCNLETPHRGRRRRAWLRTPAAAFDLVADPMKHLLEQRRGFASDAPHQLRTPLAGSDSRTPSTPSPPIARRPGPWWRLPLGEIYRLQQIIDGLLLLSRPEGQALAPVRICM